MDSPSAINRHVPGLSVFLAAHKQVPDLSKQVLPNVMARGKSSTDCLVEKRCAGEVDSEGA